MDITGYWVINGGKKDLIPVEKEVVSEAEIERYREFLERKHGCFKKVFGKTVRVKDINFVIFNDKRKILK